MGLDGVVGALGFAFHDFRLTLLNLVSVCVTVAACLTFCDSFLAILGLGGAVAAVLGLADSLEGVLGAGPDGDDPELADVLASRVIPVGVFFLSASFKRSSAPSRVASCR